MNKQNSHQIMTPRNQKEQATKQKQKQKTRFLFEEVDERKTEASHHNAPTGNFFLQSSNKSCVYP